MNAYQVSGTAALPHREPAVLAACRRMLSPRSAPLRMLAVFGAVLSALLFVPAAQAESSDAALWTGLGKGGHVVLMRHALAPGTGDPEEFSLAKCETQRNLSAGGRAQAKRIGDRLRTANLPGLRVYSSQWCRCLETAKLLGIGNVGELPALNSFFRRVEREPAQTRSLTAWIAAQPPASTLVLVTHQVNITALTGVFPASGEMVVLQRSATGGLDVIGRVRTD